VDQIFRFDRDVLIFVVLLLSVVLLNVLPIPPSLKLPLFIVVVILQALFVYQGIKRHRP